MAFLNRCIWTAASSGLGDFVVSAPALNGYTPFQCTNPSLVDGATYHYFATSGNDHEEGDGVFTGNTLARTTIRNSSNGGAKVNFAAAPVVSMGGPTGPDFREKLAANRTYYIRADGNDNNSGLYDTAAGAFLTTGKAFTTVSALDTNGFTVTIQYNVPGTTLVQGSSQFNLPSLFGGGSGVFSGDPVTPANVVLQSSTSGWYSGFALDAPVLPTMWTVKGFTMSDFWRPFAAYNPSAWLIVMNCALTHQSGSHFFTYNKAQLDFWGATLTITGGSSYANFVEADYFGIIRQRVLNAADTTTFTGACDFLGSSVAAVVGGIQSGYMEAFWLWSGPGVTGQRYYAASNTIINVSGASSTHIPGSLDGVTTTGGQYL